MPPSPDDLLAALERLINDAATEADLAALRQAILSAGESNALQIGKYNVRIGEGQNIQICDRFYSIHLPSLGLGADRIVEDQETCHHGFPRTTPTLRSPRSLAAMFGLDQRLHLLLETSPPRSEHLSRRPGPAAQKTRETRKTDPFPNTSRKPGERGFHGR